MGVLEEIPEKLDSTESKKNILKKSIVSLVTDWREVEKDLELTQNSFQHYLSEHRNGGIPLSEETHLALKEKELKEREVSLNGLSEKLESDREELAVLEKLVLERLRELGLNEERLELREWRVEEREKIAGASKLWDPLKEDRERAVETKEKEVALMREDLQLKEKDIDMLLNFSEKREKELDARERQLELKRTFVEELESSLKSLEEELEAKRKYSAGLESSVKSLEEELEVKRKDLTELESSVKSLEEELEAKKKYYAGLESSAKSLEEESEVKRKYSMELGSNVKILEEELGAKRNYSTELESNVKSLEEELGAKRNDLAVAERRLMECQSEMELLEVGIMELEVKRKGMEGLKVREKQLELKEKQCRSEKELLERGKKELEQKMVEFEAQMKASEVKEIEVRRRDLEHRNLAMKEIEAREKKLKAKEKELKEVTQRRLKEWQLKQKQCQSDNRALDLRMKEFEDRIKAFEIREKEFKLEEKKLNDGFSLQVELDGLDVHILLNGLKIDFSSPVEVSKALRLSGAPVHLVLSAIEALYPPYLMKVDMRFEGSVGRSCILLLEQLIIISPEIQSQQREHALKLATEWKDKISLGNSLEVLAFLYFLASFALASSFDTEEVIKLFETVAIAEHEQIPDLCHRLGLKDRMSVSKSCKNQDREEIRSRENPICSGSDLTCKVQGQVDVAQEENPSTNLPNCLKGCKIDPELSNTDLGTSKPMAIILANMDAKSLFSFLNSHCSDHPYLKNEVLVALEISHDSAKLVLDVVECFYWSYPEEQGSKSCILLLDQLMRISPLNLKDVQETAQIIALDWKAKIIAESKNSLANLVFLVFVNAFRLVSAFDSNELLQLYKIVSEQKSFGIPEVIYGVVYSQLESQQIKTEVEMSSDIAPKTDVELFHSNVNMESDESRIPMFLKHSSDTAELVLDALDFNNFSGSKEKKISVVESFFYLLKQVASVSPKIEPCVRKRASKFALDWKSKLTCSNAWEVLAFLMFVGVYGLLPSFGAKYLMGLLEVHYQLVKEASSIIRILKLGRKAPGFIRNLIGKKQRLLAVEYVYEFNLVNQIPPVALLKKYIIEYKLAAKKCMNTETEALDAAISDEISAIKNVIKCIFDHSLESQYSPDTLRERITRLEFQKENLKRRMPVEITNSSAELNPLEEEQLGQEHTRKRPASDPCFASVKDAQPPPKKLRHRNNKFSKDRSSLNVQPASHHPEHIVSGHYPVLHQQAGHAPAPQFVSGDGRGNQWAFYDNLAPHPPIFFAPYRS